MNTILKNNKCYFIAFETSTPRSGFVGTEVHVRGYSPLAEGTEEEMRATALLLGYIPLEKIATPYGHWYQYYRKDE